MNDNKMTILLIDDDPQFTSYLGKVALTHGCSVEEDSAIQQNFNLIWLKDMPEIKAYFDAIKDLKITDSRKVNELGVLPDIMVFDYCLTRGKASEINRSEDATNPNVPLYTELQKLRPGYKTLSQALEQRPGGNVSYSGNDRYGLMAGAAFFNFFFDYVTTGIPTTAHSDIAKSPDEAGFVEWLHEDQMQFADLERPQLNWGQLLFESLTGVRDRFIDLIQNGAINVNVYGLIDAIRRLGEPPFTYEAMSGAFIEFTHSSYGRKKFLLSALFYDHFFDGEGKTLLGRSDHSTEEATARNSELIVDAHIMAIIDSALRCSVSPDEYVSSYDLCMSYIQAWINDKPLGQPFLTKRGYSKDRQKRLFLLAMVLTVEKMEIADNARDFRSLLTEIFFSGYENNDAKRAALQKAGIKIDDVLSGSIPDKEKAVILLHSKNVSAWPHWWKL